MRILSEVKKGKRTLDECFDGLLRDLNMEYDYVYLHFFTRECYTLEDLYENTAKTEISIEEYKDEEYELISSDLSFVTIHQLLWQVFVSDEEITIVAGDIDDERFFTMDLGFDFEGNICLGENTDYEV